MKEDKFTLTLSVSVARNGYGAAAHYQEVTVMEERQKAVKLSINNRAIWLPKAAMKVMSFDNHFVGYELAKWFKPDGYQKSVLWDNCTTDDLGM